MRQRPSGSVPGWAWGVVGAVVALVVAVPLLRRGDPPPAPPPASPPPAVATAPAPVAPVRPAAPAEPTLEERRARYVAERARELVAGFNAGLGSAAVSEDALASDRALAEEQAGREWEGLVLLTGGAEELGLRSGEVDVYRAAVDRCWPVVRDIARYDEVDVETVKRLLEEAADQERLARRIGGR